MTRTASRREFLKLAGLLPMLGIPGATRTHQVQGTGANVLFLVFDTLSARHLSLYGYPRQTTPNLARFADRATVFHRNYSGGSFTTSGAASLLTGLYPSTHRALQAYSTVTRKLRQQNFFQLFKSAGYHTLSFSQNLLLNILVADFMDWLTEYIPPDSFALAAKEFSDDFFTKDYGIAVQAERTALTPLSGFPNSLFLSLLSDWWGRRVHAAIDPEIRQAFPRDLPQNHDMYYRLEDVMDWAIDYFPGLPKPFAAYLHNMPPHDPYNPRGEFIDIFAGQPADNPVKPAHFFTEGRDQQFLDGKREQYDEYIAYVDSEFGRLIDGLELRGVLDNTWIIFTSDHGELFERGIYRHITPVLYEPIIHVPLLIRAPSQLERLDFHNPTSSADILPTLLTQLGMAVPPQTDGHLLPPWAEPDPERFIFSVEGKSNPKQGRLDLGTIAALHGDQKLVHYFGYDGYQSEFEAYDLAADPEELHDEYDPNDPELQRLAQAIAGLRTGR